MSLLSRRHYRLGLPHITAALSSGDMETQAKDKQTRTMWTPEEVKALVRVWGEKHDQLRSQKRNAAVYDAMARDLAAVGLHKTRKQIHTKIENMTQEFR